MTDNTAAAPASHDVDGASNYTPPSYAIAPEDAAIAHAIVSQDPLALPSAHEITGNPKITPAITLNALPPHLREAAQGKIGVRVSEAEAVQAVLRENALDIRSKGGFAASVDPFWHELATISREHNEALAEFDRLSAEVAGSVEYEKDGDGQPKAVIRLSEGRQRAIRVRQSELLHRLNLLADKDGKHGPEAELRLKKALHESVEKRKAAAAEIAIHTEAVALADKMLHDERVQAKAAALAKHKRLSA